MHRTHLIAMTAAILAFVSDSAARTPKRRVAPPIAGNLMANQIEDSTNNGAVGPGASGPQVVRAQILLDRARFSPGEIDGKYGDDLGIAIRGYQQHHRLKVDGVVDAATWRLLNRDHGRLLTTYGITAADEKGPFETIPTDIQEQAKLKSMSYESPQEELGERFHISPS